MKAKQYLTLGLGIVAGFGISVVGVSYASQNLVSNVKQVTPEVAKSIMLNKVPGATISKFYLDNDATPEYDGELIKGDYEYDISVDAVTGEIREFSKERIRNYNNPTINNSTSTNSNTNANNNVATNNNTNVNNNVPTNNNGSTTNRTYIGESKARSIMLSNVPGATIRGFHFDNDSTPEYEAELIKDGYEYDISVNALTGEIIEFSKERIEPYDDDRYDYDDDYDDEEDEDQGKVPERRQKREEADWEEAENETKRRGKKERAHSTIYRQRTTGEPYGILRCE